MKLRLLATLPVFITGSAFAADSNPWVINATLGLTFTQAAEDSRTVNFLLNGHQTNKGVDRLEFDAGMLQYARTPDTGGPLKTTQDAIFGGVRYDRNLSADTSWYAAARARRDRPHQLDLRYTLSAGISRTMHADEIWNWHLGAGIAYRNENFSDSSATVDTSSTGLEISSRYGRVISDRLSVRHTLIYQPAFSDWNNYLLTSNFALSYAISAGFELSLTDVLDFVNQPPAGGQKQSNVLFLGLGYRTKL